MKTHRNVVTAHQIGRDLQGNLLADATIEQIFTIEDGSINLYEIGETETIKRGFKRRDCQLALRQLVVEAIED